eukprot:CAMPEP_0117423176 /NCGR_PEP_ID=MMETSP0758-20121206/3855_1 /TAXON_ID=63605 /ORGANISM="Percolomonas cosmopolitus, Strain AE-1 (ATCC 50343)" /LENGTH=767 /DNA_ID=CAMNT_0005206213 /DNA_START=270 /DNA_END=2573 /DNA_ORIENTATION=+
MRLVQYLPHNAFIAISKGSSLPANLDDLKVNFFAEYTPNMKISRHLNAELRLRSTESKTSLIKDERAKEREEEKLYTAVAIMIVPETTTTIQEVDVIRQSILKASAALKVGQSCRLVTVSSKKMMLPAHDCSFDREYINMIAQHPLVHYIDTQSLKFNKDNKFSRGIIQSNKVGNTPFSNINTKDLIVAVGDSGLDVHNCFFYDSSNPVPFCNSDENPSSNHRKISGYNTFMDGEDDAHGHGTHVVGSIVGQFVDSSSSFSEFNGMSQLGKIAFFDIGCSQTGGCRCDSDPTCPCSQMNNGTCPANTGLFMPVDLNAGYFPWTYKQGARIHSNSIGDKIGKGYDITSVEIDTFQYEHDDFLVTWSAGNSGRNVGFSTLTGGMKMVKNSLVVGASVAPQESFEFGMQSYNNYTQAAKSLGASLYKQYKCGCSTCDPEACQLAEMLADESSCCHLYQDCSRDIIIPPNPFSKAVKSCCKQCALQWMKDAQDYFSFGDIADFSSIGPTLDGRIKPDIVAPGLYIYSAKSHGTPTDYTKCDNYKNDFKSNVQAMAGTSMATPTLAGTVGLIRSYLTTTAGISAPSGSLIRALAISSARFLKGLRIQDGPLSQFPLKQQTIYQGYGLVNLENVLPHDDSEVSLIFKTLDMNDQSVEIDFEKSEEGGDLVITIAWTDKPGSPAASMAIVNDFDLQVTDPSGNVLLGNVFDSSMTVDRINNNERVHIQNAASGSYKVKIVPYRIVTDTARLSYVISGDHLSSSSEEMHSIPVNN